MDELIRENEIIQRQLIRENEISQRQRRLLDSVLEMQLYKCCGAVAMLWRPATCRQWNIDIEDPKHYVHVRCPVARSKWRFSERQARKLSYYARYTMESECRYKGFRRLDKMLGYAPENVRKFIEEDGKSFQQWICSDARRFLRYHTEPWADVVALAIRQYIEEKRSRNYACN